MSDVGNLFLEYARLDRRRREQGLAVAEHERWAELKAFLAERFGARAPEAAREQRESVRVPTRIACSFESMGSFERARITNLSRGGVFIATRAPLPVGSRVELRIRIEETGSELEVAGVVVTNHVGPDLATEQTGMGIRFSEHVPDILKQIDELYERTGVRAAREAAARRAAQNADAPGAAEAAAEPRAGARERGPAGGSEDA